jgi:glycosyltransferase involved in cell wall biosynthesis
VINDGSSDDTAQLAIKAGAVVISHLKNEGKGAALKTGFSYCLQQGYEAVVTMDSDGQHDIADIPKIVEALSFPGVMIAVGERLMEGSSMPLVRRLTNQFMSWVISMLARQKISDSQCGFRVIRKEVLESINLSSSHFDLESELLIAAGIAGWRFVSVPIQTIYNKNGSHIRPFVDGVRFIRLVFRYMFHAPRQRRDALH